MPSYCFRSLRYFAFFSVLLAALLPCWVQAAIYYVAPNGSDSSANPTVRATPWKTLNGAHTEILPDGATVYVRSDTPQFYRTGIRLVGKKNITIKSYHFANNLAYDPEAVGPNYVPKARLDLSGKTGAGIALLSGCENIVGEGFEIHNAPTVGVVINGKSDPTLRSLHAKESRSAMSMCTMPIKMGLTQPTASP